MTYLSEDPTYLAGGLVLLAGAFFVAVYATQQGKYLIPGAVALGLALVMVVVEWLWVTDTERIEQVVYDIRNAVLRSDAEGVLAHMAPNVQYLHGDTALSEEFTRALIRTNVGHARFDFVRISNLQTNVAQQARRGKPSFGLLQGARRLIADDARCRDGHDLLVVGFSGGRAARLEGEPDQPRVDSS